MAINSPWDMYRAGGANTVNGMSFGSPYMNNGMSPNQFMQDQQTVGVNSIAPSWDYSPMNNRIAAMQGGGMKDYFQNYMQGLSSSVAAGPQNVAASNLGRMTPDQQKALAARQFMMQQAKNIQAGKVALPPTQTYAQK